MKRRSFVKLLGSSVAALPLATTTSAQESAKPAAAPEPVNPLAPAVPSGAWTFAAVPDTQSMALSYPDVLVNQTEWIVANQGRYNILFVAHEGDIVNNNSHPEWLNARRAMDKLLKAKIPFSVLPGNHDLGRWGYTDTRDTHLNDYFTFWDYKISEKVGYFERTHIENSWHHLSTPTGKFLVLALEFGPRSAVLEWANKVVAENADRQVIVVTHAYLYSDSTRYDLAKYGKAQEWNPKIYPIGLSGGDVNDAEEMWTKFVSRHANIRFVLSGHVLNNGTGYLVSDGAKGNRVHQILANYQGGVKPDRGFGGAGFFRLMTFAPDGKTVSVRTYSPWLNKFLTDSANEFVVTL